MFELNTKLERTEEKNLKAVLMRYLKYWYLFCIGILLCVGAAFLYLRYKAVPLYRITSTVLVKDKDKGSWGAGRRIIGGFGADQTIQKYRRRNRHSEIFQSDGKGADRTFIDRKL